MVRQWQELFFERRYSEVDLSDNPDFAAVAGAFGIASLHVDRADRVEQALRELLDTPGPALLHVAIDQAANVWPLVPPNRNNAQMLEAATESQRQPDQHPAVAPRSEEHTSELQSLMRISYAVFCLKKKKRTHNHIQHTQIY